MSEAKITWKAFGDKPEQGRFISSVVVDVPEGFSNDLQICEAIYKATNLQGDLEDFGASIAEGRLWKRIESVLSATRTHTSISVGDEIEIGGQVYICADFGFEKIENVEIQYIGDSIFSVRSKQVA
jgi:hypothetical protein